MMSVLHFPEIKIIAYQGLFLSLHVSLLRTGQQSKGVVALASTKPYGALMISIQLVCILLLQLMFSSSQIVILGSCTLMCVKSGNLEKPSGKEGGFSKDNWGDYIVKRAGGTADKLV